MSNLFWFLIIAPAIAVAAFYAFISFNDNQNEIETLLMRVEPLELRVETLESRVETLEDKEK